jgi:hypothetical protein
VDQRPLAHEDGGDNRSRWSTSFKKPGQRD